MTTGTDKAAINDARALLDALLASDWRDVHVTSGGTEIFIARAGGGANPMRASAEPVVSVSGEAGMTSTVAAPHVATLVSVAQIGADLTQGDIAATIEVLGEEESILAPVSGRVAMVHVEKGGLIEFNMPILEIAASVK